MEIQKVRSPNGVHYNCRLFGFFSSFHHWPCHALQPTNHIWFVNWLPNLCKVKICLFGLKETQFFMKQLSIVNGPDRNLQNLYKECKVKSSLLWDFSPFQFIFSEKTCQKVRGQLVLFCAILNSFLFWWKSWNLDTARWKKMKWRNYLLQSIRWGKSIKLTFT